MVNALVPVTTQKDSTLLASAGEDPAILLWDPTTASIIGELSTADVRSFSALAVVPILNGETWLAAGSADGSVSLWDMHSLRLVASLATSGDAVLSMATAPLSSGRHLLAIASTDGAVRLWDAAEARVLRTIRLPFDQHAQKLITIGARLAMCTDIGVMSCEIDIAMPGVLPTYLPTES